ncbi:hypothetical protein BH20ACT11_BH20ACT11_04520 [soil metagenome]
MSTRVIYATMLGLLLTLAAASPALAHTQVVSSDPEEGASLERAPERVSLTFDGPVEAEFSPLEVYDEQDERVDLDNARLGQEETVLMVDLEEGLGGGEYKVEYRYTGLDGHPIEGSYDFSVSGDPAPAPTGAAGGTSSAAEEQQTSQASGSSPVALYGALGLGAVVILGVFVLRRR